MTALVPCLLFEPKGTQAWTVNLEGMEMVSHIGVVWLNVQ